MIKVEICKEHINKFIDKCGDYLKILDIKFYNKNEHRDIAKIYKNHFEGKLAEFIAAYYLYKKYRILTSPDISKHSVRNHDADLVFQDQLYHVKSCNGETKRLYGLSWCFQLENPLLTQPEKHFNENVILVYIGDKDDYRLSVHKWNDLYNKLKEPAKPSMKGKKKFIYATDL